ncbi:hypothetical protein [Bradyrhizobium sp. JYMT SZCCT0428]|nr:hypothetical protein [Bradyrhizobium sp. JYMT SZCCT0428]MBR1155806.1 hypothetical protein [Bradyrhizobium sp. JYMT SZCCT0428]
MFHRAERAAAPAAHDTQPDMPRRSVFEPRHHRRDLLLSLNDTAMNRML